jgi:hypothetical protein
MGGDAAYLIEAVAAHDSAEPGAAARLAGVLAAVRRVVRRGPGAAQGGRLPAERLMRRQPWDRVYAELRRVVETCGRYPKTTDAWVVGSGADAAKVCLYRFYRNAADEYRRYVARGGGAAPEGATGATGVTGAALEPHQARDLERLPAWTTFGVEGPYPWRRCVDFLERWLEAHGGVPPMVNVNIGGYVGLEATDMERLSGALTCINQQDGRDRAGGVPGSGFAVGADKCADLDRVCGRFGLRWRKARGADGALVAGAPPTFIQESYARFKAHYAAAGPAAGAGRDATPDLAEHFPGYPAKHRRMESLAVQAGKLAPPRWRVARPAAARPAARPKKQPKPTK